MKRMLLFTALVVLVLGLMACGGQTPAAPEPEPEIVERVVTAIVTQMVEGESVEVIQTEIVREEVVVTATPEPEQAVVFESSRPDTLVNATFGGPEGFDPALNYETSGNGIISNVYEPLIFYDGTNAQEFVPMLAESYEVSEDGLTYTFTIREGITFHDGAELTPSDVAYSFQRGILQGGPSSPQFLFTEPFLGVGIYDIAETIDPVLAGAPEELAAADSAALAGACESVMSKIVADDDAGTVVMTLAQPWAPFLATAAGSWGSIVDQEWAAANGAWDGDCATWQNFYGVTSENNPLNAIMNGTGPYMLDHWT
ncbi:MAG: ABC transporter substrate-binding protein, partial [Ardenticatenaceae bacterium]